MNVWVVCAIVTGIIAAGMFGLAAVIFLIEGARTEKKIQRLKDLGIKQEDL